MPTLQGAGSHKEKKKHYTGNILPRKEAVLQQ